METPNAPTIYLQAIEGLLEKSEIEYAVEALLNLEQKTQAGLRPDIIQQSGNFQEAKRSLLRGVVSYEEYNRNVARVRFALLELLKELPGRLQSEEQIRALNNFQFELSDEMQKLLGASVGKMSPPSGPPSGESAIGIRGAGSEVGLKESPPAPKPASPTPNAIPKFVVVYDQADTPQCQLLNKYLNILKITKKVRVYNVQEALAQDLLASAETELADADYLLALVTVNLFNSPDWFGLVLSALEQGRRVIPIRIEKIGYEGTGLERLLSLPTLNRAISDFPNLDAAYADVVSELRKLLPR